MRSSSTYKGTRRSCVPCWRHGAILADERSSSVPRLFDVAAEARLQVLSEWVPTHGQKADPFTRGTRGEAIIDL